MNLQTVMSSIYTELYQQFLVSSYTQTSFLFIFRTIFSMFFIMILKKTIFALNMLIAANGDVLRI